MTAASEVQLLRSLCKASFKDFVREFWHTVSAEPLSWNWHLDVMCAEAQAVAGRVLARTPKEYDLIVNVPPGTTKSSVWSVLLPAWCWANRTSFATLGASHSYDLALDLSRKTRDCVRSELYGSCFPQVRVREDQDTKGKFMTTTGGVRQAVGSNGSIIGVHFDLIVVDDPIDPQEVLSEPKLDEVNRWIEEYLSQRKKDHRVTATVLVMQRLHQNDPSARMGDAPDVKWYKIPSTTEYEIRPPELADFYRDGLMDPVRLPRETLEKKKKVLGDYGYSGQFGQCLVAGTLVATDRGWVGIEGVTTNDLVRTREGFKTVSWSGRTGETADCRAVLFSNGASLTGTGAHPVWTDSRGFVPLDSLQWGDYTTATISEEEIEWEGRGSPEPKCSSSTARSTSDHSAGVISVTGGGASTTTCTATCGGTPTAAFPVATTSITRTKTRATIELKISNAFRNGNTGYAIPPSLRRNLIERFSTKFALSVGLGISPKKAASSTRKMVGLLFESSGPRPSIKHTVAKFAGGNSSPDNGETRSRCTVLIGARKNPASGNTINGVRSAAMSFRLLKSGRSVVPGLVVPVSGGVPVYDLTVDGVSEFYANGILVHNSPRPAGGGLFKAEMLGFGDESRPFRRVVRFWDKAACLVNGTLVRTRRGNRPIESVRAGDRVLTRSGYRRVTWAGVSKWVESTVAVKFADGSVVEGTEDHPVWTENRGWVWLAKLRGEDRVVSLSEGRGPCRGVGGKSNRTRKSSCFAASDTRGVPASGTSKQWLKAGTGSGGRNRSTGQFINTTTVTFPTATTFITRTATGTTTRSITWSVSPDKTTSADTLTGGSPTTNSPTSTRPGEFSGGTSLTSHTPVSGVVPSSSPAGGVSPGFVPSGVVARLTPAVPVYDLQVEGTHEFFANGILVHNTSAASPKARKAAWTVGVKMAEDYDGHYWVLDVIRVRMDTFSRERLIRRTAFRDGHGVVVGIEQEGASGGVDSAKTTVQRLAGFSVRVAKARQNKEARAYAFSVAVNQGLVKLPARLRQGNSWRGWAKEFVGELEFWPFSTFRDQGDAASGAYNLIARASVEVGPIE